MNLSFFTSDHLFLTWAPRLGLFLHPNQRDPFSTLHWTWMLNSCFRSRRKGHERPISSEQTNTRFPSSRCLTVSITRPSINSPGRQQMNLLVEKERMETWAGLDSMLKSSSRPGLSILIVFMPPSRPVKYLRSSSLKAIKPPWISREYNVSEVTSDTSEPLEANSLPVPFLSPYFFTGDKDTRN